MNTSANQSGIQGLSSLMGPSIGGSNCGSKVSSMIEGSRITLSLKLILLGDVIVGKTTLFTRYISNTCPDKYKCTISVECKTKTIALNQSTIAQLEIWDTAGEERYRALTRQYYRSSNGIILLFDLTDKRTFENLPQWINDISANCTSNSEIFIVGNKMDMIDSREVKKEEAEKYASSLGYIYIEISAKIGSNVDLLFEKITYEISKKMQAKQAKEDVLQDQDEFLKKKALEQRLKQQDKKREVGCC